MTDVTAELVVALEVQELLTMLDDYFDRYIGATSEADMSLEELLISRSRTILAALARAKEAVGEGQTDQLVDRFAEALKEKLRAAEAKYGYSDAWTRDDWAGNLRRDLLCHVWKGDPRDVAAYCAFAWHHGWSVAPEEQDDPIKDAYDRGWIAALARAKDGEWRHPSDVPQVKAGQPDWRIVAVRRAHNGQLYRFPALYLDKVSLWFEDDNEERSVTGWFSPVSGEDGETYHELLGEGDVLEAWRDLPSAPSDAILAALQEPGHG